MSTNLAAGSGVTRVAITISPGGPTDQTLAYDAGTGAFAGSFTVSAGDKTVTATAYSAATVVGTGAAAVSVGAGATALVNVTIYDTTAPPPVPDHGPVILTFVIANTTIMAGVTQTLSATAFDPDGPPIVFSWTESPPGCGTFASPGASTTQWTAGAIGTCTVAITVTANGKSDQKSQAIQIVEATGLLDISGRFVPEPFLTHVAVLSGGSALLDVSRTATDATSSTALTPGATYEVRAYHPPATGETVTLTDSCGGPISTAASGTSATEDYAAFSWTAPVGPNACVLTPDIVAPWAAGATFHDAFPIVVRVGL